IQPLCNSAQGRTMSYAGLLLTNNSMMLLFMFSLKYIGPVVVTVVVLMNPKACGKREHCRLPAVFRKPN
ncbi:hypothetical protein L9F63_023254, partial [Diploptera punctata]